MFSRSSVGAWADSWGVCSHAVGRRNSVSPFVSECVRNYAARRGNSQVMAHGLIVGLASLWLARQCVLAYAGLFSKGAKNQWRSRCVKQRCAAVLFGGRGLFFKKRLKIIGLGRFFRPERRPLQTLRPIIYRPARAYCQRMLSSRRAFRIATGGPNAPRHSRICATPWIGAGR